MTFKETAMGCHIFYISFETQFGVWMNLVAGISVMPDLHKSSTFIRDMSSKIPQHGSLHSRWQRSGTLWVLIVFPLGEGCIIKPLRKVRVLLSEAPTSLFPGGPVWHLSAINCGYSMSSSLLPSQQFQVPPMCSALCWVLDVHELI